MDGLTRDELVDALVSHSASPYRRETLEGMDDGELAAAANSTGVPFRDLRRAANADRDGGDGADLGFEPEGVLTGRPSGGESGGGGSRPAPGGGLAVHRESGDDVELGFEAQNVLSGHRGESVLDEERDSAAENAEEEGLGFAPGSILGGHRGESVLDD